MSDDHIWLGLRQCLQVMLLLSATSGALTNLARNPLNRDAVFKAELEWKAKTDIQPGNQWKWSTQPHSALDRPTGIHAWDLDERSFDVTSKLSINNDETEGDRQSLLTDGSVSCSRPDPSIHAEIKLEETLHQFRIRMQKPVSNLWYWSIHSCLKIRLSGYLDVRPVNQQPPRKLHRATTVMSTAGSHKSVTSS